MNLDQIRRAVENELQYAPELEAHRRDVRARINAAYQKLAASRPWPWLLRRTQLYGFPDLVIPNANVTLAGTGPRTLFVAYQFAGNMYPARDTDEEVSSVYRSHLSGAEFGLADASLRDEGGAATWEHGPFTIELAYGGAPTIFQLDPRANIPAFTGAEGDYLVQFRRIRLPADCATVVSVRDNDGAPLGALSPSRERRWLDKDQAPGRPMWVLEDFGHQPRVTPVVHPLLSTDVSPVNAAQDRTVYDLEVRPMRETPTLATTGGSIPVNTRVRICLAWWWSGRFGSPGEISELLLGAGTGGVLVSGFPVLAGAGAPHEYGRRVAVFMAEGESAFYLRGFVGTRNAASFSITTDNSAGLLTEATTFARLDEVYNGGPSKYLRLFPRPSSFTRLELEYMAAPRQLIEATDTPDFEGQYHEAIMWLTCLEMASRFPDSQFYRRAAVNADSAVRALNSRYFPGDRYGNQKGMIGQASGRDVSGFVDVDHLFYLGP